MLQLGRSGSLAGLACKSAPPVQGTEPVQRVGGTGITNYQLSECSNSGKVTRFSQSRPCLEGTAQQTPLGTRFSLAGQLCPAPFLGAALKPKGFAPAHYKYISLTFIFKLFCWIYCPGISPHCSPQQLTMYLDISFCWGSFLQCLHYPLAPSQPSVHKLQSTSILSGRQVFKANYQLCQGTTGRGGRAWRHVFPSEWMESAQQTKMFWARKLSCLAGNCWLCCTTQRHGSLTKKNQKEKRLKPYQWGKDILLVLLLKEHEHVREENSLDFCKRRSRALQYNHTTHPGTDFL